VKVAGQALEDAGAKGEDLDGIGITNQRETAVAWDRESGEPLRRETTALGAAYLAGIAAGTWTQEHVRGVWTEDRRFEPDLADDRRQELLADCRRALERSRRWVLADA
jgi:glycerol kinase